MQLYTREETIRKINHLGQSCRPFIFIINYLQDASYIEEVASVDPSEVVYNLNGFTNQSSSKDVLSCFEEPVHWNSYPESFDSYRRDGEPWHPAGRLDAGSLLPLLWRHHQLSDQSDMPHADRDEP